MRLYSSSFVVGSVIVLQKLELLLLWPKLVAFMCSYKCRELKKILKVFYRWILCMLVGVPAATQLWLSSYSVSAW